MCISVFLQAVYWLCRQHTWHSEDIVCSWHTDYQQGQWRSRYQRDIRESGWDIEWPVRYTSLYWCLIWEILPTCDEVVGWLPVHRPMIWHETCWHPPAASSGWPAARVATYCNDMLWASDKSWLTDWRPNRPLIQVKRGVKGRKEKGIKKEDVYDVCLQLENERKKAATAVPTLLSMILLLPSTEQTTVVAAASSDSKCCDTDSTRVTDSCCGLGYYSLLHSILTALYVLLRVKWCRYTSPLFFQGEGP